MRIPHIQIIEDTRDKSQSRITVNQKPVGAAMDDHRAFTVAGFLIANWNKLLKAAGIKK